MSFPPSWICTAAIWPDIRGALPIAIAAQRRGFRQLLLPAENAREAAVVRDLAVYPVTDLREVVALLNAAELPPPLEVDTEALFRTSDQYSIDFREVRGLDLKHAKVVAFGMTRRRDTAAGDDPGMKALIDAGTGAVTIVGKTWDLHATEVLGVGLDENLAMIADSVAFCSSRVAEVIYDAEHFFDGHRRNPEYALKTLKAAVDAGAAWLVLCDTNGGSLPEQVADAVEYLHTGKSAGKVIVKFS